MYEDAYEYDNEYDNETRADHLLTVGQVREILPLSRSRIYQLLDEGSLPVIQIGRRKFVSAKGLNTRIDAHCLPVNHDEGELPYF